MEEPGQSSGVVKVEVGDQQQVNLRTSKFTILETIFLTSSYLIRLNHVDERESVHASEAGVDAAVQHNLLVFELHDMAASSHLGIV